MRYIRTCLTDRPSSIHDIKMKYTIFTLFTIFLSIILILCHSERTVLLGKKFIRCNAVKNYKNRQKECMIRLRIIRFLFLVEFQITISSLSNKRCVGSSCHWDQIAASFLSRKLSETLSPSSSLSLCRDPGSFAMLIVPFNAIFS